MKIRTLDVLFLTVLSVSFFSLHLLRAEKENRVIAAYFENYSQYRPATGNRKPFSPSMIDTDYLTDLYYAFAGFGYITKSVDPSHPHLTGDFSIQPMEGNDQNKLYPEILKLKQQSKTGLNIFLSIGGWNFNNPQDAQGTGINTYKLFSEMVAKKENRQQFIDSVIQYAHRFNFDGIDIDWEYPGDLTRGGQFEDFEHFLLFLQECQSAFKATQPSLYLSYTAPAVMPVGLPKKYQDHPEEYFKWLAQCAHYVDRMNVMAYDYHGPFNVPPITGVNAPLNRDTDPLSSYCIQKTLQNYLSNGVPANKIILGMPTFGHTFAGVRDLSTKNFGAGLPFTAAGRPGPSTQQPGLLAYYEISDMIQLNHLQFGADSVTNTAYGYHLPSQIWVSFDTPETIGMKAKKVLENSLKGAILWSVDMDEYQWEPKFPNIRQVWNTLHEKGN